MSVDILFTSSELVRNEHKQLLTVMSMDKKGLVHVREEDHSYYPFELEKVDQTNIIKLQAAY